MPTRRGWRRPAGWGSSSMRSGSMSGCTCTRRGAPGWSTPTRHGSEGWLTSTRRSEDWAGRRSPPGRRATWRPRTWFTCWTTLGSRPGSISSGFSKPVPWPPAPWAMTFPAASRPLVPAAAVSRCGRPSRSLRAMCCETKPPWLSVGSAGVELGLAGLPAAQHLGELRRVVDVLLVGPEPVAGVLQQGEVVGLVDAPVARVGHPVPHLADDPATLLVDHVPVDREMGHG